MTNESKRGPAPGFCYLYPRPAVTVDIALLYAGAGGVEVLVIRRAQDPWKGLWALPGGYVEEYEPLEVAAARELEEETGVQGVELRQIGAFGDPGRDPRGHTISVAYGCVVGEQTVVTAGDDADDARWIQVADDPGLAFDHSLIVRSAVEKLLG